VFIFKKIRRIKKEIMIKSTIKSIDRSSNYYPLLKIMEEDGTIILFSEKILELL